MAGSTLVVGCEHPVFAASQSVVFSQNYIAYSFDLVSAARQHVEVLDGCLLLHFLQVDLAEFHPFVEFLLVDLSGVGFEIAEEAVESELYLVHQDGVGGETLQVDHFGVGQLEVEGEEEEGEQQWKLGFSMHGFDKVIGR